MKLKTWAFASALIGMSVSVTAGGIDGSAVLGGALGGAAGTAVGSAVGGRDGAILGGALGAGVGAAVGGSQPRRSYGPRYRQPHYTNYDDDGPPHGNAWGHRKHRHGQHRRDHDRHDDD